jgi:uncharacterized repeat protein (TIGR01451 family)/fimbrial isopeptide formation D2 family protein
LATIRNTLVLLVAGTLAALGLIAPATAAAEGTPDIALAKEQPAQALIGTQQEIHLTASNPLGEERGYNLSFRDELPKGVAYVPGSAGSLEPKVIGNPAEGPTTLIFENLADLSANSKYHLSFKVEPLPLIFQITKLHEYTDHAEAFVDEEPRLKPNFNAAGEVVPGSFSGKGTASATTELTAVEIVKSEPSPEGEILRGVHEHQTVYTLTVKNNHVGPTSELEVEDLLPAGLEFLGCGTVDNTTDTKTNPGSTEEYAGSGPIDPGHAPSAPKCTEHEPYSVATVKDPAGHPAGVYTQVKWKNLPELAASGEFQIQYVAAIPILQNSMTWQDGIEPTAESLKQVANLDNNTGPETFDEEPLTNYAEVHGKYEAVPVKDTDEMTRTAEDLAIQKSVNPTKIEEGEISTWTLNLEASEYRFVNDVEIDDTLPNGLCPLGKENYEGPKGAPVELTEECEPVAGVEPTYEISGELGGPHTAEYASVEEQPDGTFKIHWDKSKFPQLAQLSPSEHLTMQFPTKTRTFYQENFKNDELRPILTGDTWTNHVETQGDDFARCAPNDPLCTLGQEKIFHEETEGEPDFDVSEASQEAGGVEIDKTVRKNEGLVPENCSGNYVEGTSAPFPLYSPGDEICWTLRVKFAAKLYAGAPVVTDFIPTDEEYVPGSALAAEAPKAPEGENTLGSTFNEAAAIAGEPLEWTLGKAVESGAQVFEWRFKTKVKKEAQTRPEEITGNLMKFVYGNSLGETFPLRDRAEVEREEPELALEKGITNVGGKTVVGGPKSGVTVGGGEVVTYQLNVKNTGTEEAEETEIWDVLPEGIGCAEVSEISAAGICEAATRTLKWTGVNVPVGGKTPVEYKVKVPTEVAPGHKFINHSGVTRFKTPTNTGEKFEYVPAENINPELDPKANTKPLLAEAEINTNVATLKKEATTETTQLPGNGTKEATIGEIVDYKVTATIPANSKIHGAPVLKDNLPAGVQLVGTPTAELDEHLLPFEGVTLTPLANGAVVNFNAAFPAAASEKEHTLVLDLKGRVKDIAANHSGVSITNSASFEFEDVEESGTPEVLTKSATTPIVEPHLELHKTLRPVGRSTTVEPGEVVEYDTEVKNTGTSTANEVSVDDTVPPGMEIADVGTGTETSPTTIHWHIATIAPGAAVNLTYKLKVKKPATAASSFTNVVEAFTQSLPNEGGEAGPTPEETRTAASGVAGYEAKAENTVRLIGATVSKEVDHGKGTIGTPLTYTLHMHLPPSIKFFDTTVVDTLPNGVEYDGLVSAKCVKGCEGAVEGEELPEREGEGGTTLLGWYFGKFEAGEERELVVVFNAHIEDKKQGGAEVKAGEALTNSVVGLYDEIEGTKPTEVPNPGKGKNTFSEETPKAEATTDVVEPKLTLEKSVTGAPTLGGVEIAQPGDVLTYTLKVTNEGSSTAYDFDVEDTPGAHLVEITPGPVGPGITAPTGEPLVWHVDELAEGASIELTYTAKLAVSGGLANGDKVENLAEVPVYFGLTPAEQATAKAKREYPPLEAEKNLEVELPQLQLMKTVGTPAGPEAEAQIGKPLAWHIQVTNAATVANLNTVNVVDTLPKGWEYVAGSTTGATTTNPTTAVNAAGEEELTWTDVVPTLGAGQSKTLNFEAVPTLALALEPGIYVNHAVATGKDESGATGSAEGPYEAEGSAKAELKTPGLEIHKTPDVPGPGSEAVAGAPFAYSIEVKNTGGAVATEVEVTDVMGEFNEYTPGSAEANPTAGFSETGVEAVGTNETRVKWKIASIPAGSAVTITVPVTLASHTPENTTVVDNATVISAQERTPVSDEGSLIVHREADLSVHKTTAATGVVAGKTIEYGLEVVNHGPSSASAVKVTDPIPAGTKLVSADSHCAEAAGGGEIVCELGELASGFSQTYAVTLEVLPSTTGSVVNKATVSSPTKDPNEGNNKSEVTTPVEPEADVSIVKHGPSVPVLLGNTFEYELEVENHGPSDAVGIEVSDPLPAEVELVSAETPCEEGAPGEVTCALGTLVPGQKKTLHFTVKAISIPAEGAPVVNIAAVGSVTEDKDPSNNESKAETTVLPAADLAIVKSAPAKVEPNGELTYELHVEDLGPSIAHHVVVSDPLPAGVEFVKASEGCTAAAGVVTCETPPNDELAVNEAASFQVTVKVPYALGGQPLTNTATIEGEEGDPHTENNSSTVTTEVGPDADLSITKTMGKAQAGQPLTYTLAVTNHGPSDSSAVTVKDTLPAGTSFKSAAPSQGTCSASGQSVTCELGPLAAGGSAQVSITVEVAATATGTLRNVATVEGPEPDPDKSNNESSVEGPITPAPPSAPNLRVVKTADTSAPQVGKPFSYNVAISNLSGAEAKNVKVVDTLNGRVNVVSIEAESGHCGAAGSKITCTIPSIPVGKTVNVTYLVSAESPGTLSNTASAQAANGEVAPANNHAVKNVKAKAAASALAKYTLKKTASRKVVAGGKKVGFTIALHNGSAALVNAKVCDRLPSALVFVKAAGARYLNGEACWREKFVAAHKTLRLHLLARAVKGYKSRIARNVATASAENAGARSAAATVRIKPAFAGAPGGVTG